MSKKHFIALADAIRENNRIEGPGTLRGIFNQEQLEVLANFCQSQNPHFNRSRWLGYIAGECGSNGGVVK
jgi:hypothetical protein